LDTPRVTPKSAPSRAPRSDSGLCLVLSARHVCLRRPLLPPFPMSQGIHHRNIEPSRPISHRQIFKNGIKDHAAQHPSTAKQQGSPGRAGPAQRAALLLNLPRSILPYRHLTVLQVNVLRVSRHQVAHSVFSGCTIETINIGRGLQVIATRRSTFFEPSRVVPGA
jgi:hypothetical protein